jgi:hypothetical protein
MKRLAITFLVLLTQLMHSNLCFIPAKIIELIIYTTDQNSKTEFGQVSDTLVHEDIIKRGIIRSAAKYFYDQPGGSYNLDLKKLETGEYYNLNNLYYDLTGKYYCTIDLEVEIATTFKPNVAVVDFDSSTKDLPYAHFDAEKFVESNQRVIDFTERIYTRITEKDYSGARRLAGQILHTIQDFYSHSNWVEIGNTDINRAIGTQDFATSQAIVATTDTNACQSNCDLVTTQCGSFFSLLSSLISKIGYSSSTIACPVRYYKCSNNLVILNKLVSGYYVNQKLPDGSTISKPDGQMKCSHGTYFSKFGFLLHHFKDIQVFAKIAKTRVRRQIVKN